MTVLFRLIDLLLAPLALLGEIAVALMCVQIVVEIVANEIFRSPIEGTTELVAHWYMVAIVFLPLALIQRYDSHIKVEVFTAGLPPASRLKLDMLANLCMAGMAGLFAWYSLVDAIDATERSESLELMRGVLIVWPTRWFVPIGFATMGLVALLTAIRLALLASRGQPSRGSMDA